MERLGERMTVMSTDIVFEMSVEPFVMLSEKYLISRYITVRE